MVAEHPHATEKAAKMNHDARSIRLRPYISLSLARMVEKPVSWSEFPTKIWQLEASYAPMKLRR